MTDSSMSATDFYSLACPASAPFFGYFGAAAAMALSNLGAAYGTAKAGAGIAGMGVSRPDLVMKALIPVVMAGVVGIYGLIIAVIISTKGAPPSPCSSVLRCPCFCTVSSAEQGERTQQLRAAYAMRDGGGACPRRCSASNGVVGQPSRSDYSRAWTEAWTAAGRQETMQNGGEFNGPHAADKELVFRRGQSGDSCGFEGGLDSPHMSDARDLPRAPPFPLPTLSRWQSKRP